MYAKTPYESYRHAAETVSPELQMMMLYGSSINYIKQAKVALENKNFDMKYQLVDKSMNIIRGLRACLNFGIAEDVAWAMDRYYDSIDKLMIQLQCTDDVELCDAITENLEKIRDAWEEILFPHIQPQAIEKWDSLA